MVAKMANFGVKRVSDDIGHRIVQWMAGGTRVPD